MTRTSLSPDYQRRLIARFQKLVNDRSATAVDLSRQFEQRQREYESRHEDVVRQLTREFEEEKSRLELEYAEALRFVEDVYNVEIEGAERGNREAVAATEQSSAEAIAEAKRAWAAVQQSAIERFEQRRHEPRQLFQEFDASLAGRRNELDVLGKEALKIVRRRRCRPAGGVGDVGKWVTEVPNSLDGYASSVRSARRRLAELDAQPSGKYIQDHWPYLIAVFAFLVAIGAVLYVGGWNAWIAAVAIGACAAAAAGAVAFWCVFPRARRETLAKFDEFEEAMTGARRALHCALETKREETDQRAHELQREKDLEVSRAKQEFARKSKEVEDQRTRGLHRLRLELPRRKTEASQKREEKLRELSSKFPPLFERLKSEFDAEIRRLNEEHRRELHDNGRLFQQQCAELERQWTRGYRDFETLRRDMNRYCRRMFPPWDLPGENGAAALPAEGPAALRFGRFRVKFENLDGEPPPDMPDDDRGDDDRSDEEPPPGEFPFPAVLSYPDRPSLLLKADGTGRELAVAAMRNVMLRMLTSLPPGKVRFTIIDPTGLGQNFSAFMHLADYDERLVSSRIWTESSHINRRLLDLTEHMENVIQKYLRNEYGSIQEYNEQAGEVAEPFHVLVVANFPTNFSEEAARRLASISASGARCGVYTLISTDTRMKLPRDFDLEDVQRRSVTLEWDGAWFRWPDEDLKPFAVELDQPPRDDVFTETVKSVGRRAKDAGRVQVPFETVAAPAGRWWTSSSQEGIEVPLGRVGATQRQFMRLGAGTSQHVLISGKTGSGKSTLLHALITNLAIHYSPDEVSFYLVDFKKGVEFKTYATHRLPHARVIAIESEREFGLSVLERLDLELKQRGELFRSRGVQDVKGFRDAEPDTRMPRILLVIDEFQELFVKDDRIAHDATLLLDRLVRQGRAFGIHVLLGSQTLSGAYSLARSTLGQMAVRIALQCGEGDAHLILSEDNTAARLLSRPGEAIYNDANGLLEGNHPFQVVWLPAAEQDEYLNRVGDLAAERGRDDPAPIVFEGNVPADPRDNRALTDLLADVRPPIDHATTRIWLGSAVAIKDPTEVRLRRQGGCNVLIVGPHDESATGVLASCLLGVAAAWSGGPPGAEGEPVFFVLDGTRPEAPDAAFWSSLAERLPVDIRIARPARLETTLTQLTVELERRAASESDTAPPVMLLVHDLARFRDLRRGEDDFGFSGLDEDRPPSPDKQLVRLLRDGPVHGMHSVIWCDTYNNVNRWFDRQLLRELETRVLFQMGTNDSANLMDSPAAGNLGLHRAYLYSEESGRSEKFRPYAVPDDAWIDLVAERLASRVASSRTS